MHNIFNIIKTIYVSIFLLYSTFTTLLFSKPALAKTIIIDKLKVTKVIDGDTIWVKDINNKTFKIRLLGINSPEICTEPPEPYSFKAKQQLEYLLNNQTVTIKYETANKIDKYNRIVAHVYRKDDNLWINLELIKLGLAYVYIIDQNILYLETLIQAENIALENKLNIWNHSKYTPISPEKALNFINQYKLIIGKINKVVKTKNNLWLIFEAPNTKNYTISKNLTNNILKCNKLFNSNKNTLAIRVNKNNNLFKYNWNKYVGKTVKVRGYIEQSNKDFIPFINLKNINTIEIL